MNSSTLVPLEDELGDVIEKAMRQQSLTEANLAQKSGISEARILDAINYESDLGVHELGLLAQALGLNEIGLCALGSGHYPLPVIEGLPFCVWPLHMQHGIGVANAFLVAHCGETSGILFDTGSGISDLEAVWPAQIKTLQAVFLTHSEAEHVGGLCEVVQRFGAPLAFVPEGAITPCGKAIKEGQTQNFGALEVTALSTPGHVEAHNCYRIRMPAAKNGRQLLISGDLIFAGSVGGGFFSVEKRDAHVRRIFKMMPSASIIAPGHGPMTTVENELKFNPFLR
jgi:glyoxylase-like metal-dependent hydrolase (beta-lactamase superfamily II)